MTTLSGAAQSAVRFTTIGKGYLSGAGAESLTDTTLVIKSADEWALLKTRINKVNIESNRFNEKEQDFGKVVIIAVFDTIRYSAGHEIEIAGIFDSTTKRVVKVKHSSTDEVSINVIIQPYHIVTVVKTLKPVCFEDDKR